MRQLPSDNRGRGECRVPVAPAASRANEKAHERSHHRSTGETRHSRTQMVLTAYFVLSPATNSFCHRHRRIKVLPDPVGPTHLRQLDTSNGCQDHTALPSASAPFVSRAPGRSQAKACPATSPARGAAASTASRPTFVTMANAPLSGETGEGVKVICPTG